MEQSKKRGRSSPSIIEGPSKCHCIPATTCSCGYLGVCFEALITPDFEELASQFPDFRKAWKEVEDSRRHAKQRGASHALAASLTHSFSAALTKALLHVHFNISLPLIPDNHLCPPVPNRFFYIRWIQTELLPLIITPNNNAAPCYFENSSRTSGYMLDIGTGATCIYPLLFAASQKQGSHQHKQYLRTFFATEIDPESVDLARHNVQGNPTLQPFIHIVHVTSSLHQPQSNDKGPLRCSLDQLPFDVRSIDICMTNPPFYDSNDPNEMTEMRADRRLRTAMTVSEGSYPNGEVGFVLDIFWDSFQAFLSMSHHPSTLQTSLSSVTPPPTWCSSMIGKKTSFNTLKNAMEQLLGYSHVRSNEFGPGHMTRWFLAWTFLRPHIRSPLAHFDTWSFLVDPILAQCDNQNQPVDEVSSRLDIYCQGTLHRRQLSIQWDERHRNAIIQEQLVPMNSSLWFGDESLPDRLLSSVKNQVTPEQRRSLLPHEGHFQIEISLEPNKDNQISVIAQAFSHTRYGKITVDKLKQQMEGEICRTNRRWRRQYQRNQANVEIGDPMILS